MKILWIGDGGTPTGFSTVSHAILGELSMMGHQVHHLAIGHNGDPTDVPWGMYPAHVRGGGVYGHERVPEMVARLQPDVVCILNDSWVVKTYEEVLKGQKTVAYVPVDAENQWAASKLNWLQHVITYTGYGAFEIRKGGYTGPVTPVPHGIDLTEWVPQDKAEARAALKFSAEDASAFIIGNVNRNQSRKRLDLTLFAFRIFLDTVGDVNARLLLHCALVDEGWDLIDASYYLGIDKHVIFTGIKDIADYRKLSTRARLRSIYSALDVHVSTSIGEGWGLTNMESMACGTANLLPHHSAFAEWAPGLFYSAPGLQIHSQGINTFGHVPSPEHLAQNLVALYRDPSIRVEAARKGVETVARPEFRWANIAARFANIFEGVVRG